MPGSLQRTPHNSEAKISQLKSASKMQSFKRVNPNLTSKKRYWLRGVRLQAQRSQQARMLWKIIQANFHPSRNKVRLSLRVKISDFSRTYLQLATLCNLLKIKVQVWFILILLRSRLHKWVPSLLNLTKEPLSESLLQVQWLMVVALTDRLQVVAFMNHSVHQARSVKWVSQHTLFLLRKVV